MIDQLKQISKYNTLNDSYVLVNSGMDSYTLFEYLSTLDFSDCSISREEIDITTTKVYDKDGNSDDIATMKIATKGKTTQDFYDLYLLFDIDKLEREYIHS